MKQFKGNNIFRDMTDIEKAYSMYGGSTVELDSHNKDIFDNIISKDIVGRDIYIFITANNFELVRGDVYCINPINGHKVHFNSYKGFENYICGYKYKYLGVEKDE